MCLSAELSNPILSTILIYKKFCWFTYNEGFIKIIIALSLSLVKASENSILFKDLKIACLNIQ